MKPYPQYSVSARRVQPYNPITDFPGLAHSYEGSHKTLAGAKISDWHDQKGVKDAAMATDAARPDYSASVTELNGKPGGAWSGASKFLDTGTISVAYPFTLGIVLVLDSLADQSIIGGDSPRWFMDCNAGRLRFFGGANSADLGAAVIGAKRKLVLCFGGTGSIGRVNGVSVYSGSTNLGTSGPTRLMIGREAAAGPFLGKICRVDLATGLLTSNAPALAQYESFLTSEYGS